VVRCSAGYLADPKAILTAVGCCRQPVPSLTESMSKPDTPVNFPKAVSLSAGDEIWWCSCGKSKDQPYCDGSHRMTDFESLRYKSEKGGTVALCQCKLTKTPPFCDGSHKVLVD